MKSKDSTQSTGTNNSSGFDTEKIIKTMEKDNQSMSLVTTDVITTEIQSSLIEGNKPEISTVSGQFPVQLNLEMVEEDFQNMTKAIENKTLDQFITKFIIAHPKHLPPLTDNDVISLGLIQAIGKHQHSLVGKLLYAKDDINIYPVVTLDKNSNNAIFYALKEGVGIKKLSSYIFGLNAENGIINKFIMGDDLIKNLSNIIKHPVSEVHPTLLIEELIEPVYTEDSVNKLISIIGQDWLDSYYI